MYNDTITLFNRETTKDGDLWHPTVLKGVNVNVDKGAILKLYGPDSADNAVLNVRTYEKQGNVYINGVRYLPPKEWARLSDKTQAITFTAGNAFDFFMIGEWSGGATIYDDNYGDQGFYGYMLRQYDFVYAVTGAGFYSVIPHIEVSAK